MCSEKGAMTGSNHIINRSLYACTSNSAASLFFLMLSPISRIEYSIFNPGESAFRSFMLSGIQLRPLSVFDKSNVQPSVA